MRAGLYAKTQRRKMADSMVTQGVVRNKSGKEFNSTALDTYSRSGYIPVAKGETVAYAGMEGNESYGILVVYDSSKTFLSGIGGAGNGKPGPRRQARRRSLRAGQ